MAIYTLELYRVIEMKPAEIPRDTWLGLDDYPLAMESWRDELNRDIIDYYLNREIGQESVDMWRHAMRRKMRLVMPFYDALYMSTKLQFDPLSTVNLRTINTAKATDISTGKTESTNETTNKNESRAVNYDTPQNALGQRKDYATGAADSFAEGTAGGTGVSSTEGEAESESTGESVTEGYQGAPAALIQAYRQSLINVNQMVISELSDLFMGVWDNGDSFARTNERYI